MWHWTLEEKIQLIYLKNILNLSWDAINKIFPYRGPKTIKNQWYYLCKKKSVQELTLQMKRLKRINNPKQNTNIQNEKELIDNDENFDFEYFLDI